MASSIVTAEAHCPLCGSAILSIAHGGQVTLAADQMHPIPLHRYPGAGEGYALCDDCAVLSTLPETLTLN